MKCKTILKILSFQKKIVFIYRIICTLNWRKRQAINIIKSSTLTFFLFSHRYLEYLGILRVQAITIHKQEKNSKQFLIYSRLETAK